MSIETLQILLVDDDGHIELIRRAFMPEGKKYHLTIAGTLAEARKILKKTAPGLMIVDYLLPDGKGIELLPGDPDKLAFPVVMLTGHGDEKVATAAMKAGALDYIVKSDGTLADMPHITERILREWQHITERKQAEAALHSKQNQLKTLLDVSSQINASLEQKGIMRILLDVARSLMNSTSGMTGMVEDGHMVFKEHCSGNLCTLVDYTFKPGYGVPGHVMQTLKPYISNDAKHDAHTITKIIQELDVRQLVNVPILNRSGELTGCFEIYNRADDRSFDDTDINTLESLAATAAVALENAQLFSEHEQTEKKIQAEQKQTRQIIDTARDAFVSMNTDGIITDWNPQAEDMLGWSHEETLGKVLSETIIPEEFREAHAKGLKHYLATSEGPVLNQHIEITALHRNGHSIPVELSIVAVHTDDTIRFNAFIRDISARQQAKKALEKSREQLRRSLIGTVVAVSRAVGARDPYTAGHQQRVSQLSRAIAQEMGLESERIDGLRMGASIHDIGKIYLPAEILSKPVKLTDIEYELIKSHAQGGYDILKDVAFPWPVADIAHQHHERLDGSGYPQGLKGNEICLEAKIVCVADVVEAMSSHRPYRPSLGIDMALEEVKSKRGKWFDPDAVDACLKLFREKKFSFGS